MDNSHQSQETKYHSRKGCVEDNTLEGVDEMGRFSSEKVVDYSPLFSFAQECCIE